MKVSKDLLHELGLIHVKVMPRFNLLICTTLRLGVPGLRVYCPIFIIFKFALQQYYCIFTSSCKDLAGLSAIHRNSSSYLGFKVLTLKRSYS
jgi:hypothetical protein